MSWSLNTLSRNPGFGFGWRNPEFLTVSPSNQRIHLHISGYLSLNKGDKIRIVSKTVSGGVADTIAETVRFRIRKKIT